MISKLESDVLLDAKRRWETDASLRRMHHCGHHRAGSPAFEAGQHKYCAAVLKNHRDNQPGAVAPFQTRGDGIGRALTNPSVTNS